MTACLFTVEGVYDAKVGECKQSCVNLVSYEVGLEVVERLHPDAAFVIQTFIWRSRKPFKYGWGKLLAFLKIIGVAHKLRQQEVKWCSRPINWPPRSMNIKRIVAADLPPHKGSWIHLWSSWNKSTVKLASFLRYHCLRRSQGHTMGKRHFLAS